MKISEYLILSIAVILITLGIANLDNLLNVVILVDTAFCIILYVIITVVSKKRLEREIEFNKGKFNIANRERVEWINKYSKLEKEYNKLGIEHDNLIDECTQLEIELANATSKTVIGKNMFNDKEIVETKIDQSSEPFTEDIKQCEKCGADMNKRTKYWVCPNCKSRKKIEEELR